MTIMKIKDDRKAKKKKQIDFRPKCWICNDRIDIDNGGHTLWLEGGKENKMSHIQCGVVKMREKINRV